MVFLNILKKLPVQLMLSIGLAFYLGSMLDIYHVSIFYSISTGFIDILLFILPVIVFSFIMRALVNIKHGSVRLILIIFLGVTLSNCIALGVAYVFGNMTLPLFGMHHAPGFAAKFASSVEPLYRLNLPTIIGAEKAMLIGIVCGLGLTFVHDDNLMKQRIQRASGWLNEKISIFLSKVFIPLLPVYVFGFCLKLSFDNALIHLIQQYGQIFLISLGLVAVYISILYLIGAGGNIKNAYSNFRNMLPAGLTGFSTMSSAATMPITLKGTEANTKDTNFTNLIIPTTANIHMLGDDLTIVLIAMTLQSVFGIAWIDFIHFIPFALAFSMAKLSCVGIPGASVLVVLPVLQTHFGFTPEMISILTTIYVLQDPFGTFANVMGNGAFAMIIQRIFKCAGNKRFRKTDKYEI
jgi:Na+/H+-dicarboxylate symporter